MAGRMGSGYTEYSVAILDSLFSLENNIVQMTLFLSYSEFG